VRNYTEKQVQNKTTGMGKDLQVIIQTGVLFHRQIRQSNQRVLQQTEDLLHRLIRQNSQQVLQQTEDQLHRPIRQSSQQELQLASGDPLHLQFLQLLALKQENQQIRVLPQQATEDRPVNHLAAEQLQQAGEATLQVKQGQLKGKHQSRLQKKLILVPVLKRKQKEGRYRILKDD
jgi:hypothetical protein